MRFRAVLRHPVVDTTTAETVGEVIGFLVDPATRRVAGLRLGRIKGKASLLAWEDLKAFGVDAVTIEGAGRLRRAAEEIREASVHDLLGRRVLTAGGDELGAVEDVEFDPQTGRLEHLITAEGSVVGGRIFGVGSYAVVVADVDSNEASERPAAGAFGDRPLDEWTKEELCERAQELGIDGWASMTKEELLAALQQR